MGRRVFTGHTWFVVFAAVGFVGGLGVGPAVDRYAVTFDTPSESSLGAMPIGNGRTAANVWVDSATGDIKLLLALADALDENSNLLKLGTVLIRLDPPLDVGAGFNQTLVLSNATISVTTGQGVQVLAWVDANTSAVHVTVQPAPSCATTVTVSLQHELRLNTVIDCGSWGNGFGGASGSFCYPNGSVADFVGIYPDVLATEKLSDQDGATVAWYHRNDATRSDFFHDALLQQGLGDCGPACWDPLTNRSFGAALVGDTAFGAINGTTIATSGESADLVEIAIGVASAQTWDERDFIAMLASMAAATRSDIGSAEGRLRHSAWWNEFFNRSYLHVFAASKPRDLDQKSKAFFDKDVTATGTHGDFYTRQDKLAGVQARLLRNASWPMHGESPVNCSAPFRATFGRPLDEASAQCVAVAAAACNATPGCVAFALSHSWGGGWFPQTYSQGLPGDPDTDGWVLFVAQNAPPPPTPPPVPTPGLLISRQNVLMRYMDVCSSGRIGGGANGDDFFALKYNGGLLTAELEPKVDYRAWGPGQWWQNLRLPYYTMLAEGGADLFKPLLRWYRALLPLALRRTEVWFNETDAAGRDLRNASVHGAFFIETMTQFGVFLPSEKGYHCAAARDPEWTADWAGNPSINLHREGSMELIMLALDYFEHTGDTAELQASILPIAVAVTDFVRSYFGRSSEGQLEIWPTQSLEGYSPGGFPPTRENTAMNDMPWVAGLHAVLPRLLRIAADYTGLVSPAQVKAWQTLLAAVPSLPFMPINNETVFAPIEYPFPEQAHIGGTEQPYMYPVHPFRLATVVEGGDLLKTGRATYSAYPGYGQGWQQGVMNVALLGNAVDAAQAVYERASTLPQAMRFPAYMPSMQDFRPNEDHLSNFRSALQYMIMQHSNSNGSVYLFPAWPCDQWSIAFKLHAPNQTVVEGDFNHTTGILMLSVEPSSREKDVVVLNCATKIIPL